MAGLVRIRPGWYGEPHDTRQRPPTWRRHPTDLTETANMEDNDIAVLLAAEQIIRTEGTTVALQSAVLETLEPVIRDCYDQLGHVIRDLSEVVATLNTRLTQLEQR